jgi:RNA polymerase-binding transcription factor DksA
MITAAVVDDPARRQVRRDPGTAATGRPRQGLFPPAWRALLESRWRERVGALTELSVAYYDAAECSRAAIRASNDAGLRQLMRDAVDARRALTDTEEALARLASGRFGRCEQCAAPITAAELARDPEARYCARCARRPSATTAQARAGTSR